MNSEYARITLVRARYAILFTVLLNIGYWLIVAHFFGTLYASATQIGVIAFSIIILMSFDTQSGNRYIRKMSEGHLWLLWGGHFLDHRNISLQESNEINPNPENLVWIDSYVHVGRTEKDLLILKLTLS